MAYKGKQLQKNPETNKIHKKSFPQKTIPKIVSLIVHRKGIEKRNPKLKNLISIDYHFHKNRPQTSYQWGTLGNSRIKGRKQKKF